MAQWVAALSGTYGGSYRLYTNVDLIAQNEDANYSVIQYSAWVDRVSSYGGRIYNNFNTYGHTNINGNNPQRGPFRYDMSGPGRMITMASNEQYGIGHDGNGNANPYFASDYNADNGTYLGSAAAGGNMGLPGLYRYAAPTYVEFNSITDVSFNFRVVTNRVVDLVAVRLNGSDWLYTSGSGQDYTIPFNNLKSDTDYTIHISLRRQSDGYWQEYGDWTTHTATQNKFFDIGDF